MIYFKKLKTNFGTKLCIYLCQISHKIATKPKMIHSYELAL